MQTITKSAKVELDFKSIKGEIYWRIKSCKYDDMISSSMWIGENNQPICCGCLGDDVFEETDGIDWGGYICNSCGHGCADKGYCWFDFVEGLGYNKILTLKKFELLSNYNYQEISLIEK